jgi:hypothetical protein
MKIKGILYFMMISCLTLAAKCQDTTVEKIEFTSLTRGYHKQVLISADSLIAKTSGRDNDHKIVKRKLVAGEWEELLKSIAHITLAEIPELPSPTSRRTFDGARHSTIEIFTREGKSYTHSFDDENPNGKLQSVMEIIIKMQGVKEN